MDKRPDLPADFSGRVEKQCGARGPSISEDFPNVKKRLSSMCQAHSQPELLHLPATVGNHKPRIRSGLCPKPLSRRERDTGKPETSGTRRSVEESIQSVSRKHPKPTRIGACRCHLAPSRAAERPDEASDRTRTGRNGRNGAHSENARSYPITVGKRKGTHEPPFPKNDAPEENDGTKRRYTQAALRTGRPQSRPRLPKRRQRTKKTESRPAGPAGNRHGKTRRPFCRINRQWESPRLPAGADRRPTTARTKTGTGPTGPVPAYRWNWRESNPRPNKEPEGFLHAYPSIDPLAATWPKATQSQPQPMKSRGRL